MRIQVQRKHHGKSAAKAFVALDTYLSSVANPIVCDDTLIRSFMANLLLGLEPANPIGDPQGTPHGGLAFSSHLAVCSWLRTCGDLSASQRTRFDSPSQVTRTLSG